MAILARYGNVQPSEFEGMEWSEALHLTKLVQESHASDVKREAEFQVQLAELIIKAIVNTSGGRIG